jgi:hypothetical protein
MPTPPLDTRFLQLALERVGAIPATAQTSSGFAEAYQIVV